MRVSHMSFWSVISSFWSAIMYSFLLDPPYTYVHTWRKCPLPSLNAAEYHNIKIVILLMYFFCTCMIMYDDSRISNKYRYYYICFLYEINSKQNPYNVVLIVQIHRAIDAWILFKRFDDRFVSMNSWNWYVAITETYICSNTKSWQY
jgi:hypothetical protein